MAQLYGLKRRASFEEVGSQFPNAAKQLPLKKWSRANAIYKRKLVRHLHDLDATHNVMFGVYVSNDTWIAISGAESWQRVWGPFPQPTSFNKKGKPRIEVGGYKVDGKVTPKYTVLIDELKVLGWYAESLASAHEMLVEINQEDVQLEVLIDRLPGDQGPDGTNKAILLKETCNRMTNGQVKIMGVPAKSDAEQRDLLVDNLCGLYRELVNSGKPQLYGEVESVFRIRRPGLLAPNIGGRFVSARAASGKIVRTPSQLAQIMRLKTTTKSVWRRSS